MAKTLITATAIGAALATVAAASARAATYEVFDSGLGVQPFVGAIANGLIYGTDPSAGGNGALFTVALHGKSFSTLHSFAGSDGSTPNARLVVRGGKVFGTTQGGGSGGGTAFGIAANGSLLWSHNFTGGTDGSVPRDGLALAPNGFLYGTTSEGALSPGNGALFRFAQSGQFHVLYDFRSRADGHCPFTGVAIDAGGDVFGTTVGLGFGGEPMGAVWEAVTGAHPKTLAEFQNNADGEYPQITPTLDGSGNVWGVIQTNVSPGVGAIWELTSAGITAQYSFTGGADGATPNGPLLLGSDSNLYGTTSGGGGGLGTLFQITPSGQFTVVHTFSSSGDGGSPTGSLAADTAGHIYGGTTGGTIFRVTP